MLPHSFVQHSFVTLPLRLPPRAQRLRVSVHSPPAGAGAFWKRANTQGALLSVVFGIGTWFVSSIAAPESLIPANLIGLFASAFGMLLGSLTPEIISHQGTSVQTALTRARKNEENAH